ncbi:MAG: Fe-S protein assembly co-chaperone HscB [Proteobacteria bacterium]|nr:Fe-S protein assembly co-chaperone HscB [Pseudomonadota bacterium]
MARASSSDAFGALGLPARFDLDPQVIEQAFFERSKELHPDRFATAPAAERVAALSRSRALNDAYQTLKKPVPRAEYLLACRGVKIGDNERLDPTFLMEILEEREALAEARIAKDRAVIETFEASWKAKRAAAITRLGAAFAGDDVDAIKRELILLRYVDRYLEECDAALEAED